MFEKVAIIGVGLLGGSFALALREQGLAKTIVGVSRRKQSIEQARELGVIDTASDSIQQAVTGADLVLLATPMLTMEPVLKEVANYVSSDCLITDVGSVKQSLVELVEQQHPQLLKQFVFAHPIAGGEKSGASASRADLFVGKHLILVDTEKAEQDLVEKSRRLWVKLGANVVEMGAQEHDKIFAYTSHLPHAIAFTLVNNLHHQSNSQELFNFASAGFYDFTRIASSDPLMWRDICLSNKEAVLDGIQQFFEQLRRLQQVIEQEDADALKDIFSDAKAARDEGLIQKNDKT